MNELLKRSIFGALFAAVVISLVLLNEASLIFLLWIIGVVGIYEFLKLRGQGNFAFVIIPCIVFTLFLLLYYPMFDKTTQNGLWLGAGTVLFIWLVFLLFKQGLHSFTSISDNVFSLAYIGLPLLLFYQFSLGDGGYDFRRPLLGFILVWSSDTFAYVTGRAIGKTPLYPSLSPKKTIEGFLGGTLLTGILGAYLCLTWEIAGPMEGAFLGIGVGIFGTAGDLFESVLKRNAGVKDSGKIIPGHGGILDRFDAFLFAALVLWIWNCFLTLF